MTDIRSKSDDEIRESLAPMLGVAAADVSITRADRHDRTSPVQAITTYVGCADGTGGGGGLTFLQLTELAGACMTPDITIMPVYEEWAAHVCVTIRWGVPLATGEVITVPR